MVNTIDGPVILTKRLVPWLASDLSGFLRARRAGRLAHGWIVLGPDALGNLNLALNIGMRLIQNGGEEERQFLRPVEALAAMEALDTPFDHHPDLLWIRPEQGKRAIGVEQIRAATDTLALKSFGGGAKVVVIEPADAMTIEASNALLKTLEEPTGDTYLLLVTCRASRLLPTVRSRCQRVRIRVPPVEILGEWLGVTDLAVLARDAGLEPLNLLRAVLGDDSGEFERFETRLSDVYERNIDPQVVADEWSKHDLDQVLGWLVRRLQHVIRARSTGSGSNRVTEIDGNFMHNAFGKLTLTTLFDQLDKAEQLREQVGTGINTDLGLRLLLMGFRAERKLQ
jgi:DNA polymerase-3 subunit delta'